MTRLSDRADSTSRPSRRRERLRRYIAHHARASLALVSSKLDAFCRAAYKHSKRRVSHQHGARRAAHDSNEPRCADCGETFDLWASDGAHMCTSCATTEALHAFLQGPA